MKIFLVPEDGSRPFELAKDITLIGRSRVCDIQLLDKSVSKLHCVLVKTDSLAIVRDLGSTNGTRVKDMPVKRGVLLPNDELVIGRLRFRLQFVPDNAPMPKPSEDWIATEQMSREEVEKKLASLGEEDSDIEKGPASSPLPSQEPEIQQLAHPQEVPFVPPVVDSHSPAHDPRSS